MFSCTDLCSAWNVDLPPRQDRNFSTEPGAQGQLPRSLGSCSCHRGKASARPPSVPSEQPQSCGSSTGRSQSPCEAFKDGGALR